MLMEAAGIRDKRKKDFIDWAKDKKLVLTVVQAGNDEASTVYIRSIVKYGEQTGVRVEHMRFPEDISERELLSVIDNLNKNPEVTAVMVAKPLPAGINATQVTDAISPGKDVEGIHPFNLGQILTGAPGPKPATAQSAVSLLKAYDIPLKAQRAVVIGRSLIVGLPLANLLIKEDATVTVCHSRTRDLPNVCREADILIAAVGKANFVTPDMVKPDAVVVDVGTNVDDQGKLVGDVSREVYDKVRAITPVPGGVGSLTFVELFDNLRFLYNR